MMPHTERFRRTTKIALCAPGLSSQVHVSQIPVTFHFLSASFCTHQQPKIEYVGFLGGVLNSKGISFFLIRFH